MLHFNLLFKVWFFILMVFYVSVFQQIDAREVVRKADEKYRGSKSSYAEITITIERPGWSRQMSIKTWTMGEKYAMVLATAPPKEKGTAFLKRDQEIWNWVPRVERTIKLPPSMMSQSWMGTDFTNDDLIKQSSVVNDYNHSLLSEEVIDGLSCHKIQLIPKPDAAVVWGKIITWIDKKDFMQLKVDFYDEYGDLINTMKAYDIKELGGKILPTTIEMIPHEKKGYKTIMQYHVLQYEIPLNENFFSTSNMLNLR